MSEQEARTEKYGFTQSAISHLIDMGEGHEFKREELIDIDVVGDDPRVSRLGFELMAASAQHHWYGTVTVPENADVNTKLWAPIKMSPPMLELYYKLIEREGLPTVSSAKTIIDKLGEPDPVTGRPTK